ncbi:MAG: PDZ domain-containing protein, partial [Gammaproteobacteria bacterium]
ICEQHIRFFGEPAPMDQYWFLTMAVGKGYGGLEHRASSSLLCRRDELPLSGSKMTKAYRRFLGLVSHEYFHSWNVKRMKPAVFSPYELDAATPTEQLWIFEGITSYYDELALLRSGLIDTKAYLEMLAENLTRVYQTPGRTRQTLAESSYDAWIKFYQRNENSPNTVVSYYTKGAATALVLDLQVRRDTSGNKSLDDVMRAMWQGYGDGRGVPEGAFETLAEDVTGLDVQDYFDKTVRSTEEIPLEELFDSVGVKMTLRAADSELGTRSTSTAAKTPPVFGAQLSNRNNRVIFQHVYDGGPAQTAGIAAGDELIAIDDLRINTETFKRRMRCCRPGDRVSVRVFRRDELMCFKVKLGKPHTDVCRLRFDSDADADTLAHRAAWLEGTLA